MELDTFLRNFRVKEFRPTMSPEASGWTAQVEITTPTGVVTETFESWASNNYTHQDGTTGLGEEADEVAWEILNEFSSEFHSRLDNAVFSLVEELSGDSFPDIITAAGYGDE